MILGVIFRLIWIEKKSEYLSLFWEKKSEFWEKKVRIWSFSYQYFKWVIYFQANHKLLGWFKGDCSKQFNSALTLDQTLCMDAATDIIVTAYFLLKNYALQRIPYPAVCELVCWNLVPDCTCDQRPSICLLGKIKINVTLPSLKLVHLWSCMLRPLVYLANPPLNGSSIYRFSLKQV